jgi:uncharacterized protein YjcR
MSKPDFKLICGMLAAKNLYEAGVDIDKIASQANKSPSVIRKWLKTSGARRKS